MKKLAIITEHLSTGGMPALIALEAANRPDTNIHVFVLCDYRCYVHQKQLEALPNVSIHQFNNNANALVHNLSQMVYPDISFVVQHDTALATSALREKGIKTVRMIHSTYSIDHQIFPVPDRFIVTTPLVKNKIEQQVNTPITVVNTAVDENRFHPDIYDKAYCRQRLGLQKDDFVILHLGVWNPNKNQEGMILVFNQLEIPRKRLLLVGGQYENFREYWSDLDIPEGAVVMGEVDDPEMYYAAADLFVSTSHVEGCPMSVREAALMRLPCVLSDTIYHRGCFEGSCFLFASFENDGVQFVDFIQKQYGYKQDLPIIGENLRNWTLKKYGIAQYIESLNRVYDTVSEPAKISNPQSLSYKITYHPNVRLTFTANRESKSIKDIGFRVLANGEYYERHIEARAGENLWIAFPKKRWFIPYHCQVLEDGKVIVEEALSLKGQEVSIDFDSRSLGDTLAWLPAVYAFRRKHDCQIALATYWNEFLARVTDFKLVSPGSGRDSHLRFAYQIGCFSEAKRNWRTISLPEIAMDILGVDGVEPLRFRVEGESPIDEPYICISEHASTKAKMWNRKGGWQDLVDKLTDLGSHVAVISLEPTDLKGVLDWTGTRDIYERAIQLHHATAYIGCSSGLAWLANAVDCKVFMLNTCTFAWNEPFGVHIERNDVCRGCWNRTEFSLEKSWDWCPSGLDFQCSRYLTAEMVFDTLAGEGK